MINLSREELIRYSRQLRLSDFGALAQQKLKDASVLVVGAGGLGCPALQYLAAAGVGTIGIADFDKIELHNLQRQVLYTDLDIGQPKVVVAGNLVTHLNSNVTVDLISTRLTGESALKTIAGYDIVLDCTDNYETRYAINDACVRLGKPFVYGSVFRYEGQVTLFNAVDKEKGRGPTYRCLFPKPPGEENTNCDDAGVIGFLPGLIGTLQAAEAIKWITGTGEGLSGKLLCVNLHSMQFDISEISRNEALWKGSGLDEVITGNDPGGNT